MATIRRILRGARARLAHPRDEAGFTLVELMVAQGIILVSLLSLAYTATVGFSDIALARQRQGANGIANQILEQVRALPFDTLKRGLANSDLPGGDPAIVTSGCPGNFSYCYRSSASAALEAIPRGNNAAVAPLVPHRANVTVGQVTYSRAVYVTYYQNDSSLNAFRVTVVVSWANPARRGVDSTVVAQSVMYSPPGCVSTATHPFAAPCQPFFYGAAQNPAGQVSITGTLAGIDLTKATLWTPAQSSTMQVEQISAVQGSSTTAGLSLAVAGNETTSGRVTANSSAENDPAQPGQDYETASTSGSSQSLSAGSGNTLALSVAAGSSGSTISTTSANTSHPCASQTDDQACGRSTATQGAALSVTAGLNTGFLGLGSANVVSVASYTTTGTTNRDLDATGDGRMAVTASRSIGDVRIGGLPTGLGALLLPFGWQGHLVRVTGYSDSLTAQTGINTAAPSVTAGGTVSVWNGLGYTNVNIVPGASVNVPVTSITVQDPLSPGGLLRITLGATVRTGGTTATATSKVCSPSCLNTRTAATASAASPVIVDLTLDVIFAGNSIADLDVHVDLGTLQVTGAYTEAPGG